MALSPNKSFDLQVTGSNVNTWGVVNNANFSIVDLNLGGRLNLSVAGAANVTVTSNQAQNLMHVLSGILTGNILYTFPAIGGFYLITNNTTGAFTITAMVTGGATGVLIPQGSSVLVFVNPDALTIIGQVLNVNYFIGGTSTGSAAAQVVASLTPSGYTFAQGNLITIIPGFDSTGAGTLNANATGVKSIKKITNAGGFVDIAAGDIKANTLALLAVNLASNVHVLLNPAAGAFAFMGIGSNFQNNAGNLDFAAAPILPSATTGTTQAAADNTTKIATTAQVQAAIAAAVALITKPQLRKQVITATGAFSFTTPIDSTTSTIYKVTLTAGGGGGAGGNPGQGGSGAETIIKWVTGLAPNTAYSGSIGTNGTGGTSGNPGTDGTDTTFTDAGPTTYTAHKGLAGASSTAHGPAGGSGGNGDMNIPGQTGGPGVTGSLNRGGNGGGTFWGPGAPDNASVNAIAGEAATIFGGGGSGGAGNASGGNGKSGVAVFEWIL